MKLTRSEINIIYNSLSALGEMELPIGYAVSRNLRRLKSVVQETEKSRQDVIIQFAEKDEAGNPIAEGGAYKFPDDVKEEAFKQIENVYKEEVEINPYLIRESKLDGVEIKANLLEPLIDIIIVED